jgi:hypothetical protein
MALPAYSKLVRMGRLHTYLRPHIPVYTYFSTLLFFAYRHA